MAKAKSRITTDHHEIQRWVEEHNGKPVRVRGTGNGGDPGLLRIDFPGGAGEETFEKIPWEDWFDKFEENHLAFLYQVEKKSGEDSTFFKLVKRK
ncbi:1,4-alpha-glucan branching enzyme [Chitinispirillum alkaliphilum]|nr:1,4-alpha-glucan branching enzyme [Chitinispirillum alkaliphilum]